MYYSAGTYESFAHPEKPKDVDKKSAYIIGTGLAGLTAAFYLVRDGQMKGEHIHLLEKFELAGGSCDGRKDVTKGFFCLLYTSIKTVTVDDGKVRGYNHAARVYLPAVGQHVAACKRTRRCVLVYSVCRQSRYYRCGKFKRIKLRLPVEFYRSRNTERQPRAARKLCLSAYAVQRGIFFFYLFRIIARVNIREMCIRDRLRHFQRGNGGVPQRI